MTMTVMRALRRSSRDAERGVCDVGSGGGNVSFTTPYSLQIPRGELVGVWLVI